MNIHDLEEIEKSLKVRLPDDYKQTMLQYPFERDSYAAECLLPDDADVVIGHNCTAPFPGKITTADVQPFVVGGDGGEEVFFLDLNKNPSEVFVYSYETDGTEVKFRSWKDYLQEIEKSLQEIREDERAMAERKKNKKWWQFWI